jgi:hypothetical protein
MRILMLPDANHLPASLLELAICVSISAPIRLDLLAPEGGVGFRPAGMHRAAVPEAAVDEHSYACRTEDDVDAPSAIGQHWTIDPVPQATTMKLSSQLDLGGRVAPPRSSHALAGGLRRQLDEIASSGSGERQATARRVCGVIASR